MLFSEIVGLEYGGFFSLGNYCLAAEQLRRTGLRQCAGPFDWMDSFDCMGTLRLLQTRFADYMELSNLEVVGWNQSSQCYHVLDRLNRIVSKHDFSIHANRPDALLQYADVKEKLDRRSARMLAYMSGGGRILFVRTNTSAEEATKLAKVLKGLVAGDFRLLIVNHVPGARYVQDLWWPYARICGLQFPASEYSFTENNALWDYIFRSFRQGIPG